MPTIILTAFSGEPVELESEDLETVPVTTNSAPAIDVTAEDEEQ